MLPAAFGSSWMVNNTVPSPTFQAWLQPPQLERWHALIKTLSCTPEEWLSTTQESKRELQSQLQQIIHSNDGIVGISKVLALLCPDTVPLMDDAAIWFVDQSVSYPTDARTANAPITAFVAMLDWFAQQVTTHQDALSELAETYPLCPLSPSQVLDRLLWFESWGYHVFPSAPFWRWVTSENPDYPKGIIPISSKPPGDHPLGKPIVIESIDNPAWREEAYETLSLLNTEFEIE